MVQSRNLILCSTPSQETSGNRLSLFSFTFRSTVLQFLFQLISFSSLRFIFLPFHNRFSHSQSFYVGSSSKNEPTFLYILSSASLFHFHTKLCSFFVSNVGKSSVKMGDAECIFWRQLFYVSFFFFFHSSLLLVSIMTSFNDQAMIFSSTTSIIPSWQNKLHTTNDDFHLSFKNSDNFPLRLQKEGFEYEQVSHQLEGIKISD